MRFELEEEGVCVCVGGGGPEEVTHRSKSYCSGCGKYGTIQGTHKLIADLK